MKWTIYISMLVILATLSYSVEECAKAIEPIDINCQVTATWNYTLPCTNHKAIVYNSSGKNIINYTFAQLSSSPLCYFTWNISLKGSYYYRVTNGDSGTITIEDINMLLAFIIGTGLLAIIFLMISFMLEDEHIFLKYIMILVSLYMLYLIPASFVISNYSMALFKSYGIFLKILAAYITVWLIYKSLTWMGVVVPRRKQNGD